MLGGVRLKVAFTHERSCFAYISSKLSTNNEQNQCIQVLYKDKHILLWAVFNPNTPEGQIALNPTYSKLLGLDEGADVFVSPYGDVKVLEELYVDTDSPDDQEILEHNAELLQLRILDQLRLVVAHQKAVVWISTSLPIVFTPKQTGILVNHSRIVVKVDAFNDMKGSLTKPMETPTEKERKFNNIGIINNGMLKPYLNVPKKLILRAIPIDSDGKRNLIHPYTVFLHEDLLGEYKESATVLATIKSIPSIIQNQEEGNTENNTNQINDFCVEINAINSVVYRSLCKEVYNRNIPTILIPKTLNHIINIELGSKLMLTIIGDNVEQPEHIDIITYSDGLQSEMDVIEKFKNCVIENTHSGKKSMKSVESLIEKVMSHLYFEIHREATFKGVSEIKSNVLVTGLSGTGKSSFCHIIQKELTVWSHLLHCRSLKGRKDVAEAIGKAILMCQEHSPSVLICDDIDSLVPAEMEGTSPQDIAYYQRLATVIKHLLQTCSGVCVLMTSLSMKALHPVLRQSSGKPLFTAHFDLPELEQEERAELFKHLLNDKILTEFEVEDDDVIKMAMDTAGHNIRDITDYLNKKIFKAVKKKKAHPDDPKPRLVEGITKDMEKANEFDIWGPVGGLEDVKQELTECIFWPIMYPALFPSQSCGILLYGPPGTGKSHIGSCLAKLTNMNLIAVKGPELLSKYIGQSEKAVRDIFDKADMKRPCILFFDEFDSLAPKRGHDSTGVTDRVVNQLLARMDGAEGGARGPVVAATSRPDLVDPALLRPGRLQRHIYCAPPDQHGRYEVLKTLSSSVLIDEEVDLHQVADQTEGFSPADLKSLLVTAQLTRLEKQLDYNEDKSMESVVVYKEDIESALAETKPSLSKDQRLFYDMIYRRFRGENLSSEQRKMSADMLKQRVTLA
ncbi:ATPase family associated with various cellular activities (AAA) domain-containing protein [Phthorimaea operculella]|nr:ATPase family associated with various cellular activities (AAA) domain-containing protein [Phthorimaea operculella]